MCTNVRQTTLHLLRWKSTFSVAVVGAFTIQVPLASLYCGLGYDYVTPATAS